MYWLAKGQNMDWHFIFQSPCHFINISIHKILIFSIFCFHTLLMHNDNSSLSFRQTHNLNVLSVLSKYCPMDRHVRQNCRPADTFLSGPDRLSGNEKNPQFVNPSFRKYFGTQNLINVWRYIISIFQWRVITIHFQQFAVENTCTMNLESGSVRPNSRSPWGPFALKVRPDNYNYVGY